MEFGIPEETSLEALTIRSYSPGDGAALAAAVEASYEHLRRFMPWATPTKSADEAEKLVATFRSRFDLREDFTLGIFEGRALVGGTGFHLREGALESRCAEIGLWLATDHAGRGVGTALLRHLLAWGFDAWPWLRLSWHCDSRNVASARVAEKAGMRLEGTLRGQWDPVSGGRRDTRVYAALRDEWDA